LKEGGEIHCFLGYSYIRSTTRISWKG